MAWMSNYTPLFYIDMNTKPCPNTNIGVANYNYIIEWISLLPDN